MFFRLMQAIYKFILFIMAQNNAIALKLPELWRQDVRLWFVQVEAAFIASNITQDSTKYYNVVSKLDGSLLSCVSDIISAPPATDKYTTLKDRIIKEFDISPISKLDQVFNSSLGEKKPSQLFREMTTASGENLSEASIKQLWLLKLPKHLAAVLSVATGTIQQIVDQADKMMEYHDSSSSTVAQVSKSDEVADLKEQIAAINRKLSNISFNQPRSSSSRNRSPTPYRRQRSNSPHRSPASSDFCWYHAKFGKNASKCRPPCSYQKN